ncbi:MAG TPA: DUF4232 domain-containing protein [Streptosporangiaceae bacterium]|jgi:hypothetical protein
MKLSPRLIRRASATAAAVAAALLIPAAALAAPGRAAAPAAAPGCTQAQLRTWIGLPGDGTAGTVFYELEISNVSARTCTLLGFPGVSATGAGGAQLGSPARRSSSHPVRLITLARGATAHANLGIVDVFAFPAAACHPVTATGLRVFAPGDFRSETVPLTFKACQRSGVQFLNVTATVAGTGIPLFSS